MPLALAEEEREIRAAIERGHYRAQLEVCGRGAAQPLDLLESLRRLRPTVVHFSGHGERALVGGAG